MNFHCLLLSLKLVVGPTSPWSTPPLLNPPKSTPPLLHPSPIHLSTAQVHLFTLQPSPSTSLPFLTPLFFHPSTLAQPRSSFSHFCIVMTVGAYNGPWWIWGKYSFDTTMSQCRLTHTLTHISLLSQFRFILRGFNEKLFYKHVFCIFYAGHKGDIL